MKESLRAVFSMCLWTFPRSRPAARTWLRKANWKPAQCPTRPFSSNIILQTRFTQNTRSRQTFPYTNFRRPPPPPQPFGSSSSRLVVGVVIAGCVGLYGYQTYEAMKFNNGSGAAYAVLQSFEKNFVLSLDTIREGRYYVLVTSSFAHHNMIQLAIDMLALWGFGRSIVSWFGLPHFAMIWAGSAATGALLELGHWQRSEQPVLTSGSLGASGPVFGMMSAMAFMYPQMRISLLVFPVTLRAFALFSVCVSLGSLSQGWMPNATHADHLGGMAFGFVYWLIALRKGMVGRFF